MVRRAPTVLPLLAGTPLIGLVGGAWLIRQSAQRLDASRLIPVGMVKKAYSRAGPSFYASRRAVQAAQTEYSVAGVLKQLNKP